MIELILVIGTLLPFTVYGQVDCSCGTSITDWQCTDFDGNVYVGGNAGYSECIDERDDLWESEVDCKYCFKCVGSGGLGECECDVQQNCSSVFIIVGIIMIVLGVGFMIWQGFILYKFFKADGECKDVWKLCGCFLVGLACLIIGITMVADQSLWYGIFS